MKRVVVVKAHAAVAVIRKAGRVLLETPGAMSPLRGRWDLPAVEHEPDQDGGTELAASLMDRHGLEFRSCTQEAGMSHGIMNRRIRLTAYSCSLARGRVAGRESLRWVGADNLDSTPVSGATLKVMRAVQP
jgi:hypothetical protein